MKVIKKEIPQEHGFYFAKQSFVGYWQLLITLSGKAPFLKVTKVSALINDNALSLVDTDLTQLDWSEVIEISDVETNTFDAEYVEIMRGGEKLRAVKLLKERTGWGLKEAKEYCDALQAKYLK